jgi:hypothetical protein
MRQRQGGRWGSNPVPPGGKRNVALAEIFEQDGPEELGVEVGAGQLRILGGEVVELEEALESLEDELDLPAEPYVLAVPHLDRHPLLR